MSRPISRFILPELPVDRKILQVMDELCSISYAVAGIRGTPEGEVTIAKSKAVVYSSAVVYSKGNKVVQLKEASQQGASPYALLLNKEDRKVSGLHEHEIKAPKNSGKIEIPLWVDDRNCILVLLRHLYPNVRTEKKQLRAAAEAYEIIDAYWRQDSAPDLLAEMKRNTIIQKARRLAERAERFAISSYLDFYSDMEMLSDPNKTMSDAWEMALGWRPFPPIDPYQKDEEDAPLTRWGMWDGFSLMVDRVLSAPEPPQEAMDLFREEFRARAEMAARAWKQMRKPPSKATIRALQNISHLSDLISIP